jgi:hypothetical protein
MAARDWGNLDANEPLQIGSIKLHILPHYINGIDARVFLVVDEAHIAMNFSADDARRFADRLKIAACQAESIGKQADRRHHEEKAK